MAWQLVDDGEPSPGRWPMIYDTVRQREILLSESGVYTYGDNGSKPRTWELVNGFWTRRFLSGPAPVGSGGCATYDTARHVMVIFGGFGNDQTWEYDGSQWAQKNPSAHPPGRSRCGMTYDSGRQVVVMFGGLNESNVVFGDHWEYNGTTWTQRTFSTMPGARAEPAISFDSTRNITILFGGGIPGVAFYGDTWEFDGNKWRNKMLGGGPSARGAASMGYDPTRMQTVLFGGYTSLGSFQQTWEWNGTTWTLKSPTASPEGRRAMALVWDTQRATLVGFGGEPPDAKRNDTWTYDGTTWVKIADEAIPEVRRACGVAFDSSRDRLVLYGGKNPNVGANLGFYSDTWQHDGAGWSELTSVGSTTTSENTRLIFDTTRGNVRGFSGYGLVGDPPPDVHELAGTPEGWQSSTLCCPHPDGRTHHAVTYAPSLGGIAVYGGLTGGNGTSVGDFWTLDGNVWSQIDATPSPGTRVDSAIAFDSKRNRLILYGGTINGSELTRQSDTWAYDGSSWTQLIGASAPGARRGILMAYDVARDRVVMLGDSFVGEGITWEFDGSSWIAMPTPFMPDENRGFTQMVFDSKRAVTWVFGGTSNAGSYFNDTWAYGPDPDGDRIVGGLDNCPNAANVNQANDDADVAGNVCDCAPVDPGTWSAPQPIGGLLVSGTGTTTLTWADQSAIVGPGVRYDVATGDLIALQSSGSYVGATCLVNQAAVPSANDARLITPGNGYWYLVRARNVCGLGTYGAPALDGASPCP